METEPSHERRRPSGLMILVIAGCALIGLAVAWQLRGSGSGSPASAPTTTASTASSVSPRPATGAPNLAAAVFQAPRDPSDALPPALRAAADHGRLGQSRRIAAVRGSVLYAWPVGRKGLCSGLGDGTAAHCEDVGPAAGQVGGIVLTTSGTQRYVGGVVGSGVVALSVAAPGLACSVRVERSGFLCAGPVASTKPVQATLHLRNGDTTSLTIG